MTAVRGVLRAGAILGEGARWDVADQALYWVDIKGRLVHRYDPASGVPLALERLAADPVCPRRACRPRRPLAGAAADVSGLRRAKPGRALRHVGVDRSLGRGAGGPAVAGGLLALEPGVRGLPEARFRG